MKKKGVVMEWIPKRFLDKDSTFAGIGKHKNNFGLYKDNILIQVEIRPIIRKPKVKRSKQ